MNDEPQEISYIDDSDNSRILTSNEFEHGLEALNLGEREKINNSMQFGVIHNAKHKMRRQNFIE